MEYYKACEEGDERRWKMPWSWRREQKKVIRLGGSSYVTLGSLVKQVPCWPRNATLELWENHQIFIEVAKMLAFAMGLLGSLCIILPILTSSSTLIN